MLVQIKKVYKESYWYADKIGQVFDVTDVGGEDFIVRRKNGYYIRKEDCKSYFVELMEKAIDKRDNNRKLS